VSVLRTLAVRGARWALRYRYPLLLLWAVPWFVVGTVHRDAGMTDWLVFEFGARTLIHYNSHYGGGALHLYANYPFIQIGPPALLAIAAVQWLPHGPAGVGVAAVMALGGVASLRCIETTAFALLPAQSRRSIQTRILAAGALTMPLWSYECAQWRHLDDVMAVCFIIAATSLVARQRSWWLAGAFVGLGVAAKPWAIIMAPVLLGLTRTNRSRATLVALATATACWAPFVIGGPGTIKALGSLRLNLSAASSLHTLGVHLGTAPNWVRPVQMVGGFVLMIVVARRGHWVAVPFAGLAFRVVSDPQTWLYYGLGPLMAAVLWDSLHERRWPVWTIATVAVEYAIPWVLPGPVGLLRLVWAVAIVGSGLAYRGIHRRASEEPRPATLAQAVLEPAG
jgi:hypothetical protein